MILLPSALKSLFEISNTSSVFELMIIFDRLYEAEIPS